MSIFTRPLGEQPGHLQLSFGFNHAELNVVRWCDLCSQAHDVCKYRLNIPDARLKATSVQARWRAKPRWTYVLRTGLPLCG